MANDATLAVKPDPAGSVPQEQYAPDAIWREAERLLYREARLLDTERLSDWLEQIVDPTVRYMVVSRELRFRKEKRYGQPAEVFMYDDDYDFLKARVEQFHSGMQWRVDPPERYRRLVTNIEVFETGKAGEIAERFAEETVKGEIVLLIAPQPQGETEWTPDRTDALLRDLLASMSVSKAAKEAASVTGLSKSDLYARLLDLKDEK